MQQGNYTIATSISGSTGDPYVSTVSIALQGNKTVAFPTPTPVRDGAEGATIHLATIVGGLFLFASTILLA